MRLICVIIGVKERGEGGTNSQRDGKIENIKKSEKRHQNKEGDESRDEIQGDKKCNVGKVR